jgi:hypothetical protein
MSWIVWREFCLVILSVKIWTSGREGKIRPVMKVQC